MYKASYFAVRNSNKHAFSFFIKTNQTFFYKFLTAGIIQVVFTDYLNFRSIALDGFSDLHNFHSPRSVNTM